MAQLIAVSGTQGSGKSTLIKALSGDRLTTFIKGHFVYFDHFKVSRSVQAKLGWTLANAIDDIERVIQFQELIYDQKLRHDIVLADKAEDIDFVFVERSFIDIAAYTVLWFEQQMDKTVHQHWMWLETYLNKCAEAQKIYDGIIIIPKHPEIAIEQDPHRASSELNNKYEKVFQNKYLDFCQRNNHLQPFVNILDLDLKLRMDKTIHFLDSLPNRN
jgi:predicted ATPase